MILIIIFLAWLVPSIINILLMKYGFKYARIDDFYLVVAVLPVWNIFAIVIYTILSISDLSVWDRLLYWINDGKEEELCD